MAAVLQIAARVILAQNRVIGTVFIRTPHIFAACRRNAVSYSRAAFGGQQIVISVMLHKLRSLGLSLKVTTPDQPCGAAHGAAVGRQLRHADAAVEQHIMPSIVIVEDGRVYTVLMDPRRLTVGTLGSLGTDDHLTARLRVVLVAAVGSRNKIMLGHCIVGYIRRPIAAPAFGPRHSGPVRVCNGVADSRPVY